MRPGRVLPKAAWREQSAAAGSREQPRPLLAPLVETGRVLPEGGWREQPGATRSSHPILESGRVLPKGGWREQPGAAAPAPRTTTRNGPCAA